MKLGYGRRSLTSDFKICSPETADIGRWRVRLSKKNRFDAGRHCLLKISHGDKSGYFVGLGHNKGDAVAQMDLDLREHLGVSGTGDEVELKIELINGWRSICWYLRHRDPYVYVPAWVGFWSLILGVFGLAIGILSLCLSAQCFPRIFP